MGASAPPHRRTTAQPHGHHRTGATGATAQAQRAPPHSHTGRWADGANGPRAPARRSASASAFLAAASMARSRSSMA
eukprot:580087-Prymnesium_polylepis.1